MATQQHIEPGLLKVFRIAVSIELVLIFLGLCGDLSISSAIALLHVGPLALLLAWNWLRRRMGHYFLPVALAIAWIGPVLGHALLIASYINQGRTGADTQPESGGLLLWLIVPLLLVSSQYRMKVMFAFNIGTAILQVLLAIPLAAADGPPIELTNEEAIVQVVLFTIVGFVVVRLSAAQREQRTTLAEKNAQLSHYANTLEQLAVSRERNRMARELHDTLAHTLSAVSVQLGALEVLLDTDLDQARSHLRSTHDMARSGVQEARRALQALRASPLEDLGLRLALRQLAESASDRAGLRLELDLPETLDQVQPAIEQHLYRIAEEALTNVVRHANAKTLHLGLQQHNSRLTLTIRDDGVGFNPAHVETNGHYGLVGMRERVLLCGGALEIESQSQKGTTLVAVIEENA